MYSHHGQHNRNRGRSPRQAPRARMKTSWEISMASELPPELPLVPIRVQPQEAMINRGLMLKTQTLQSHRTHACRCRRGRLRAWHSSRPLQEADVGRASSRRKAQWPLLLARHRQWQTNAASMPALPNQLLPSDHLQPQTQPANEAPVLLCLVLSLQPRHLR